MRASSPSEYVGAAHQVGGPADVALAVAGTGPSFSGHLLLVDGLDRKAPRIEPIDHLTSHVLGTEEFFFRVIHSTPGDPAGSELLVYDRLGVAMYRRISAISDPHGFAWTGQRIVVPNTHYNQIVWITPDGVIERTWQGATSATDCWHVNGVEVVGKRVVATAFGRFASNESLVAGPVAGHGILFEPESDRDLVTGLSCPHDPRFVDGGWLVCDSGNGAIVHVDEYTGRVLRSVQLGRWTRGIAIDDECIYVGLSAQRYDESDTEGALAVVDRATWELRNIVPLPCKEVNSLSLVSRSLLGAIRRGFRTNAYRVHVQDVDEIYRSIGSIHPRVEITPMHPLDESDCCVSISVDLPERVLRGQDFEAEVRVTNNGARTLFSAPPHPINLAFNIADADGHNVGPLDNRRAALLEPIPPGQDVVAYINVQAPDDVGTYTLTVTLVQESICWFNAIDPENEFRADFKVVGARIVDELGPNKSIAAFDHIR